ncbi:MAG: DUF2800 domain-containing protein [Candidatus Competibacteraceae bacterium]|nr:DUF2800 domain-containing protein [Candidatus Competibacteraceae bacterium]
MLTNNHVRFGGSTAKRWQTCPASLAFSLAPDAQKTTSEYADEGTRAHEVAERLLQGWTPPPDADSEMVRHGQAFADHVRFYADVYGASLVRSEEKVLSPDWPDVGGTIDALVFSPRANWLGVFDYKYGAGIAVSPKRNDQLLFYAALSLANLFPATGARFSGDVSLIIYQPRGPRPGLHAWDIPASTVYAFLDNMNQRIAEIKEGAVDMEAGDHCRWCEAKATCPAFYAEYIKPLLPTKPLERLDAPTIFKLHRKAPELSQYIKALEAYIKRACTLTGSFEGYTLGRGRGATSWVNPVAIEARFTKEEYPGLYKTTLVTPKQAIETYPDLALDFEGNYKQITYDKLVLSDTSDFDVIDD